MGVVVVGLEVGFKVLRLEFKYEKMFREICDFMLNFKYVCVFSREFSIR